MIHYKNLGTGLPAFACRYKGQRLDSVFKKVDAAVWNASWAALRHAAYAPPPIVEAAVDHLGASARATSRPPALRLVMDRIPAPARGNGSVAGRHWMHGAF